MWWVEATESSDLSRHQCGQELLGLTYSFDTPRKCLFADLAVIISQERVYQ